MPQKCVFVKYPLMTVPHGFLSCGLVRTDASPFKKLYQGAQEFINEPSVWEGAFRLAVLTKENPLAEPVADYIAKAVQESENGAFPGSVEEQICIARAAMALFEYNTDRAILRRIAAWCRYLEIEWDHLFSAGRTLFCPADLMELLVRYYQVSGLQSTLRLCSRLRSAAFDWTTALHTVQQMIQLESREESQISFMERIGTDELDYNQKQVLLNHAETLADGVRYTLYAGLFSGNQHDLTAGRTAWTYLQRRHGALCGGTTADPFLTGAGGNAAVSSLALAAWAEAFAAQMLLKDSEWATDEAIRIFENGLSYCLNAETLPAYQYVNRVEGAVENAETAALYARMTRAAARLVTSSITVTVKGIRINYLTDSRYAFMIQKQPFVLRSDGREIRFFCRQELNLEVDFFSAGTDMSRITAEGINDSQEEKTSETQQKGGLYVPLRDRWHPDGTIALTPQDVYLAQTTHHQGICFWKENRLMVWECGRDTYQAASALQPGLISSAEPVTLYRIDGWHLHGDRPDDIPVLPSRYGERLNIRLVPYATATNRITMFPRINPTCLK